MSMRFLVLLALSMLLPISTGCAQYTVEELHGCMQTVSEVMPYPKQMQATGRANHGINNFLYKRKSYKWRSDVIFGTRYHIAFSVEVELSPDHSKVVRLLGEPKFRLFEFAPGTQKSDFDEEKKIYYGFNCVEQIDIDKDKWAEVVKAGNDVEKILAVFGLKEKKEVIPGFKEMADSILAPEPPVVLK